MNTTRAKSYADVLALKFLGRRTASDGTKNWPVGLIVQSWTGCLQPTVDQAVSLPPLVSDELLLPLADYQALAVGAF